MSCLPFAPWKKMMFFVLTILFF